MMESSENRMWPIWVSGGGWPAGWLEDSICDPHTCSLMLYSLFQQVQCWTLLLLVVYRLAPKAGLIHAYTMQDLDFCHSNCQECSWSQDLRPSTTTSCGANLEQVSQLSESFFLWVRGIIVTIVNPISPTHTQWWWRIWIRQGLESRCGNWNRNWDLLS